MVAESSGYPPSPSKGSSRATPSVNPHLLAPVRRFGANPEVSRLLVLALHGRGHDPERMRAEVIDRLGLDDVTYVVPEAKDGAWYPKSFMAPFDDNQPRLDQAFAALDDLSTAWEKRGFPRRRQVVMGFSQGACLACEYVYRRSAQPFAGLVAFTGGLLGPRGSQWKSAPDTWRRMPVLLGGSRLDPWVPYDRMQETAEVFAAGGAGVRSFYRKGDDHAVYDEQIIMTHALLDPLRRRQGSAQ